MELTKDFSVEITKKQKLDEVCNSMCHNFYWLVYGRIYNADKTRMRKFKVVISYDIFDIQENFDKERISQADHKEYVEESTFWFTQNIISYNDCKTFFDECNQTIENWNKLIRRN